MSTLLTILWLMPVIYVGGFVLSFISFAILTARNNDPDWGLDLLLSLFWPLLFAHFIYYALVLRWKK